MAAKRENVLLPQTFLKIYVFCENATPFFLPLNNITP
jgi:hypothetical protein